MAKKLKQKKSWQEKLADSKDLPKVITIGDKMSKRWGEGTVVIPAPKEVDEIMKKVPVGKVITIKNIREILAKKHRATIGCHYAASKAGVIGLTFALATELAPQVTVNAVAPGPVDTDLITPEKKKRLATQTPFGRVALPDEIAHTVIYLLENDYVSGEVIDVNAGRYMD